MGGFLKETLKRAFKSDLDAVARIVVLIVWDLCFNMYVDYRFK